jgi:hypothetical protein
MLGLDGMANYGRFRIEKELRAHSTTLRAGSARPSLCDAIPPSRR